MKKRKEMKDEIGIERDEMKHELILFIFIFSLNFVLFSFLLSRGTIMGGDFELSHLKGNMNNNEIRNGLQE